MIEKVQEIPVTDESYPFASAEKLCGLSGKGYVEREYRIDGTANVYESVSPDAAEVRVKTPSAPYANRIVVRAPQDPAQANGNVVVEILNSTANWEIDRMWILTHREIVRSGTVYVGITSKHNTKQSLCDFNESRYSFLNWANPTLDKPLGFSSGDVQARGGLGDIDPACEPGLFWDMLTDLAWLLRGDDAENPLAAYPRRHIALMGWSQSGAHMFRYLNSFAYREDVARGGRVFDGYLAGGGVHGLVSPVNQYESLTRFSHALMHVEHVEEPYIEVQTETENANLEGFRVAQPDSDAPDRKYRRYEIAGSSHDTVYSLVDYYANDADLARIGRLPKFEGIEDEGNDYPSDVLMCAALRNLFQWIEAGVAPQPAPRIPVDSRGQNMKDAFGNTKGGVRSCFIDCPTGVFSRDSVMRFEQNGEVHEFVNSLFGSQRAFAPETLTDIYGTLEHYRDLCEANTAEQVSRGVVCKEDFEFLVGRAVELAAKRGLK